MRTEYRSNKKNERIAGKEKGRGQRCGWMKAERRQEGRKGNGNIVRTGRRWKKKSESERMSGSG